MVVEDDLPCVECYPHADPLFFDVGRVMLVESSSQLVRQRLHEPAIGHLSIRQYKNAVTSVLVVTVIPPDSRAAQGLPQAAEQAVAHGDMMGIHPRQIPITRHIHRKNRSM